MVSTVVDQNFEWLMSCRDSSAQGEQPLMSRPTMCPNIDWENMMDLKPVQATGKAPTHSFTGDVYFEPVYRSKPPSRTRIAHARFTPGARTHWHAHAVGQTLVVTDGLGIVANRAGQIFHVKPGESVYTPQGKSTGTALFTTTSCATWRY